MPLDLTSLATPEGLRGLIACPECDALFRAAEVAPGRRAACARCGTVLIAPRRESDAPVIALALAAVVLVAGALWFPFLRIDLRGLWQEATLWQVATSFSGPLLALSLFASAFVVLLPLARAGLILYTLVPVARGRRPWRGARRAFALSEALRPWSMAEIFAIGCAVSLVKIADLAAVSLGPAFWMFAGLVAVTIAQDRLLCRWSVWRAIEGA